MKSSKYHNKHPSEAIEFKDKSKIAYLFVFFMIYAVYQGISRILGEFRGFDTPDIKIPQTNNFTYIRNLLTKLPPLSHILGFIALLIIFTLLFYLVLFRYHTIHTENSTLYFKPWKLQWKTSTSYQIEQKGEYQPYLPTFLENYPKIKWKYHIKLNDQGSTIYIIIEQERKYFPIKPEHLRKTLMGILLSLNIKGKFVKPIRNPKNYKYYGISSDRKLPSLEIITSKLEKYPSKDVVIIVNVQSSVKKIDSQELGLSVFNASMIIGISMANKHQISIIKSFIKSLTARTSLGKLVTHSIFAQDIFRILRLPQLANLNKQLPAKLSAPPSEFNPSAKFGYVLLDNEKTTIFGINSEDLAQGGVICGAIGTGKTTLRLHLMKSILEQNIRVIDFDLKGDAPRYMSLGSQGLIIQANYNFHINPFICPKGYSKKAYSDILIRVFLDAIPDKDTLTPPQIHLLTQATYLTIQNKGNTRDFFNNILVISYNEKIIVDNHQENTSQSLLVKFGWMQTLMGDIFWKEENTLTEADYSNYNIFFDFSILVHTVPHKLIRFLMDLIMTRVMASIRNEGEFKGINLPKLVIFIDEAQILMPRSEKLGNLSRLEETVTTLRYKGVSVVATGISAGLMSRVLLDTGFVAQFRSESTELLRGLGLHTAEQTAIIPQLARYSCVVRSNSIGRQSIHIALDTFPELQCDSNKYHMLTKMQYLPFSLSLSKFTLDFETYWSAKIESVMLGKLHIGGVERTKILISVNKFIKNECKVWIQLLQEGKIKELIQSITDRFQLILKSENVPIRVLQYPEQFLLLVIQIIFLKFVLKIRDNPLLKKMEHNYRTLLSLSISLIQEEMIDIAYIEMPEH